MPVELAQRFSLVQRYAEGPRGDLYLVDDQQTGRRGLLKVLRLDDGLTPAEKGRLKRELLKQASIAHEVLGVPLATGEAEDLPWVFREWYEGISLRVRLTRGGALSAPEAIAITEQIASALDALHRAGLLHRDLKPGHVILQPRPSGGPKVFVIDAGIAGKLETDTTFDVFGTAEYIAPEQAQGKLVSFRSDLYALGCLLFEMLTGTPPFSGDVHELLDAHANAVAPTPKTDVPAGVAKLLSQLLSKEPRQRPFSAQQVRRALKPFLADDGQGRESTQTFERLTERRREPLPGIGTLRPAPSKPRSVPPPPPPGSTAPSGAKKPTSLPPPPPGVSRKASREDQTQELSPLDLEEAEEVVRKPRVKQTMLGMPSHPPPAPGADADDDGEPNYTQELSPLDLEQAEEVIRKPRVKRTMLGMPAAAPSAPPPAPGTGASASPEAEAAPDAPSEAPPAGEERHTASISTPEAEPASEAVSGFGPTMAGPLEAPPGATPLPGLGPAPGAPAAPTSPATTTAPGFQADPAEGDEEGPHTEIAENPAASAASGFATAAALGNTDPLPEEPTQAAAASGEAPPFGAPAPSDPPAPTPRPPDSGLLEAAASGTNPAWDIEGLDYDDLAETRAYDPNSPDAPHGDAPTDLPAHQVAKDAFPSERPAAPVSPATKPAVKLALPLIALGGVVLFCVGGVLFSAVAVYFLADGDDETTVAATEPTTQPAVLPAPPPQPVATPTPPPQPVAVPEPTPQPEPVAEPEPEPEPEAEPEPEPEPEAEPEPEPRAEPRERPRRARERPAAGPNRLQQFQQARQEALAHFRARRFGPAASAYERATRLNPRHAGSFAGLGASRLAQGRPREAVQAYTRATRLQPRHAGFRAALGRAHQAAGNSGAARREYERALSLDNSNRAARAGLQSL